MTRISRGRILVGVAAASLFIAITVSLTGAANRHERQILERDRGLKNERIAQIEASPDQALRVAGNSDCALSIRGARVKEVSGAEFTRLTGRTTDLGTIFTVPEVDLVNTSDKTITEFVLVIREPKSRSTRGLVQRDVSIAPGASYLLRREHFVGPEKITVASEDGNARSTFVQRRLDSEKYWLALGERSDVFITIGRVDFADGSSWLLSEGGEFK